MFSFRTVLGVALAAVISLPLLAVAGQSHEIFQKGKKFSEKKVSIGAGDSLILHNDDKVKHNIIVKEMDFNSGMQAPGENVTIAFDSAGKFKVRCGIHPKMKLSVTVE